MIFKETLIQSLSFAVRDSRFPPHMPRTSPFSSYRQPSPRGEGWRYEENGEVRGICGGKRESLTANDND